MDNKEKLIEIGTVVNTHGIRGEVKITPWTDMPEQFLEFDHFYTNVGQKQQKYQIESARLHKFSVLAKLEGINDMTAAERLKGLNVYIERDMLPPLSDGAYFVSDLIGLRVICGNDEEIGRITDVFSTGSNDVYTVMCDDGTEVLIPAIKSVVLEISPEDGIITVGPKEGWLPK